MSPLRRTQAFSLIELVVAIAIIGILASISTSSYLSYIERARVVTAVSDIRNISLMIDDFEITSETLPAGLADVDAAGWIDPWGNPYEFHDTEGGVPGPAFGAARKDQFLVPINSDYDLYSRGKDGLTASPLAPPRSHDDVIRARNGTYIGLAENF